MKWRKKTSQQYETDETLSTFLFSLRTTYKDGPRVFKLKQNAMDKAVSYYHNTAFDFGCNDFYLYGGGIHTELSNHCFEWYDTKERFYLNGNQTASIPKEIEIYQLY